MLKHIYNNRLVEGSLIIGLSYLTFWLAELVMGTSAVLAIVVMGLYMNQMRSVISSECYEFLHEVYELVAHLMNTIIFAIAGIKVNTPACELTAHSTTHRTTYALDAACRPPQDHTPHRDPIPSAATRAALKLHMSPETAPEALQPHHPSHRAPRSAVPCRTALPRVMCFPSARSATDRRPRLRVPLVNPGQELPHGSARHRHVRHLPGTCVPLLRACRLSRARAAAMCPLPPARALALRTRLPRNSCVLAWYSARRCSLA
jgi:hypothetical protein